MNVIEIKVEVPTTVATNIIEEREAGWEVACEGRCGKSMWVARKQWVPVNFAFPNGDVVETRFALPRARYCALCGLPGTVKPIPTAVNRNIEVLSFGFYEMKKYSVDGKYNKTVICKNGVEIKTYKSHGWAERTWTKIKKEIA